jgi:hypothetical protein
MRKANVRAKVEIEMDEFRVPSLDTDTDPYPLTKTG